MKKQILILAMFTLALVFAATNNSYGQYIDYMTGTPSCTPAVPLACSTTDDGLHPLPGKNYTYTITTDPVNVAAVHWFVTDESDIITYPAGAPVLQANRDVINGSYVLTATAGAYDAPGNTAQTIDISWKSFDPVANEVLLVAYISGAAGCSDNVEVYRIEPTFAFTLDVAALLDAGGFGSEECLSPVEEAIFDGTNLTMDYGENWIFFSVNAANFVDSWEPTFSAVAANGSTIGTIEWAYPTDAIANTTWNASGVAVNASAASGGAVGASGECIVVRVQVDHAGNEHGEPNDEVVTLSIDGVMFDSAASAGNEYSNGSLADVDDDGGTCNNGITDTETYTLTARPKATAVTPSPFIPKN
jgi:hypothetical protein